MSDTDVSENVRRLFASQSISVQVEKVYNEHNIHGQTKSLNSFTKIQENLYSPRKATIKSKTPASATDVQGNPGRPSVAPSRKTLPAIVVTDSGQTVLAPTIAPLSNAPIPSGLEAFIETDHLFVKQATGSMEMPINAAFTSKYDVFNSKGDRIYFAHQIPQSTKCCATLFGYAHTFVLLNAGKIEVLRYEGDPAGCGAPASVQIQNTQERFGEVSRQSVGDQIEIVIGDGKSNPIFVIKQIGKTGTDFEVYAVNGEVLIGRISNKWGNHLKGKLSSDDSFGISFTKALDVRMKALLLGALIMLDSHFFDKKT